MSKLQLGHKFEPRLRAAVKLNAAYLIYIYVCVCKDIYFLNLHKIHIHTHTPVKELLNNYIYCLYRSRNVVYIANIIYNNNIGC